MKISRMDAWPVRMRLTGPYTIAYETVEATVNVFLRVETNHGIIVYGWAAPDEHVTDDTDTVGSVLQTLRDLGPHNPSR